jgi:BED zinc finger
MLYSLVGNMLRQNACLLAKGVGTVRYGSRVNRSVDRTAKPVHYCFGLVKFSVNRSEKNIIYSRCALAAGFLSTAKSFMNSQLVRGPLRRATRNLTAPGSPTTATLYSSLGWYLLFLDSPTTFQSMSGSTEHIGSNPQPDVPGGDSVPSVTAVGLATQSISTSGRRTKKSKNESWLWQHFGRASENLGTSKLVCLLCPEKCGRTYAGSTGTSVLARHLETTHKKRKAKNSNTDPSQTTIGDGGKLRRICMMYDETKAEILSSMVDFVVDNKQGFRVVESPSFATFCKTMNKYYELPSRRTFVRAIHDEYTACLLKFRKIIEQIPGRVAVTADGLSSQVMRGYLW